jgi:quercetin dioxygenase-like cupin family protein
MRVPNIVDRAEFPAGKMGKCDLVRGEMLSAGLNCFEPGQEHKAHTHEGQDKLYYVVEGGGWLTIGEERSYFQAGDLALAPAGVEHSLKNDGPGRLVVLVVFAPPPARTA